MFILFESLIHIKIKHNKHFSHPVIQKVMHCGHFHDNTIFVMAWPVPAVVLVQTIFAWEGSKNTDTHKNILVLFLNYALLMVIKEISVKGNSFHPWENNVHRICKQKTLLSLFLFEVFCIFWYTLQCFMLWFLSLLSDLLNPCIFKFYEHCL